MVLLPVQGLHLLQSSSTCCDYDDGDKIIMIMIIIIIFKKWEVNNLANKADTPSSSSLSSPEIFHLTIVKVGVIYTVQIGIILNISFNALYH